MDIPLRKNLLLLTAARYLMNWQTDGTNRTVSPGEARVLRMHALVH